MQNINDLIQNKYQNQNQNQNGGEVNEQEFKFISGEASAELGTPSMVTTDEKITEEEKSIADMSVSEGGTEKLTVADKKESEVFPSTNKDEQIPASKFLVIKDIIENIKDELSKIGEILGMCVSEDEVRSVSRKLTTNKTARAKEETNQIKVVEGVFDGQNMVGGDGEHYTVPANYASKSKLVEGDLLKLTILQDGSFVYKQIAPIERRRVIGTLAYDETSDQYFVLAEGRQWKVLRASITYYKGEPGDEVTIVIPKDTPSQWAAVENIIKK